MLSRLVIAFLPRSEHFLISWLQSPSALTPIILVSIIFRLSWPKVARAWRVRP